MGGRYEDRDLIFCQPNGRPLHAHNIVRRDFRKVLDRAGLPPIRFHDLRHSTATLHLGRERTQDCPGTLGPSLGADHT